MFTDPIADMLTRIRNGIAARKSEVLLPYSKLKHNLASILQREGYIRTAAVKDTGKFKELVLVLKYDAAGEAPIMGIKRISKPGQRMYSPVTEIPKTNGGLGITIISTSKGLMTDKEARTQNVGGEVLCYVY
jgi:small subunit ribosomal protein S8